jgi:hypothetical protein
MRAYRNLLKYLSESAPQKLADLPRAFIVEQARQLLNGGDIYVLEQVNKYVPVMPALPVSDVARGADRALGRGAVDDFCFLYAYVPVAARPAVDSIDAACSRLARRGNAAGIEQVIAATGVTPTFDEETARRAYDVLIAAGRLGAVDYLRQLSGMPVRFDPDAVAVGVRALLASGRYGALRELARSAGRAVCVPAGEVRRAMRDAFADGTLRELADALVFLESPFQVEGFASYFRRLVSEKRFAEIPALFALCSDVDWSKLGKAVWSGLMASSDIPAVRFAFERCDDATWLRGHSLAAYELGCKGRDRFLVKLACERGGALLRAADAQALLDDALEEGDVAWVDFAISELGTLPAAHPDCAQLFLAYLTQRHPERTASYAATLGVDTDPGAGTWLLDLVDGRFKDAACSASRTTGHEVAGVLAALSAVKCRNHEAAS